MTWLALLLLGIGVLDLVTRPTVPRALPGIVGAGSVVLLGLLGGLTTAGSLLGLLLVAAAVVAWGVTVTRAFDHGPSWVPLALLGVAIGVALIASGAAPAVDGVLDDWWHGLGWSPAARVDPDRALLIAGTLLAQLSTANVVVRLVLATTGTAPATRSAAAATSATDPGGELKGGRLLGPMERLLILGLGLAGNLTAASIVVAAKGLLRFPELSSRKEQEEVHRLTEYFLVGSFVSWTFALASLALLAS